MNKQQNLIISLGEITNVLVHVQTHVGHSIPNKQKKHKIHGILAADNEISLWLQHQARLMVTCLSLAQTII